MKSALMILSLMTCSLSYARTIDCEDVNGSAKAKLVYTTDIKNAKTPLTLTVSVKGNSTTTKCGPGFDASDEDSMKSITSHYCVSPADRMDILVKFNLASRDLSVTYLGYGNWPYTNTTDLKCK